MRTRRIEDHGRDEAVLVPDPAERWADPLSLLASAPDPASAYWAIEEMLVHPRRHAFWRDYAAALGDLAIKENLRVQRLTDEGEDVRQKVLAAIEEHGLLAAAVRSKETGITSDRVASLLRDPEALDEICARIWFGESPYWRARREKPVAETQLHDEPPSIWRPIARRIREHRMAAAIVLVIGCLASGGAGYGIARAWLSEKLERMAQLRPLVEEHQEIWRELRFDEVIRPVVRPLPQPYGQPSGSVRVELSPRVAEGLVREVLVNFGDAGEDAWETVFEFERSVQGFEAVYDYELPPPGETRSWTLRVQFVVPDIVARAKRLTPTELTSVYKVVATSSAIEVQPVGEVEERPHVAPVPAHPTVEWLDPQDGTAVGWKPKVRLLSPTNTERITLLVRPHSGSVFYVQPGARGLQAGAPETFTVQLGSGPDQAAGEAFDILAVCGDTFLPEAWALEANDAPTGSVVGRVTVVKVETETLRDEGGVP